MSAAQIKSIWGMASGLNLTKEDVYALLNRETKKDSMRSCSTQELNKVIKTLISLKGQTGNAASMMTDEQYYHIKRLEKALGWNDNPKRLEAFIEKYYKVSKLKWLNINDASKLIESLKNMIRRNKQQVKAAGSSQK